MTRAQNSPTYRVCLRFRLLKKLGIDAPEHQFRVGQHEAVLSAAGPDVSIRDSEWLVINVRGLPSEQDARSFGQGLRTAVELASVSTRLGVDVGRDLATSGLGQHVKERILRETGAIVRDNIHGLDVFEDDPRVVYFAMSGTATVHANAEPFLPLAAELCGQTHALSERSRDVLLLLNYALMRPEPVAQIVFAFSAVETLGQDLTWTDGQRDLLAQLAQLADQSNLATPTERQEVADAVRKSLHRLTLRQGVMRLLASIGLQHLKGPWDALYGERSTLVHGLAPRPGADYSDLAHRAVTLCGHILLKAIAKEVPAADRHAEIYFPADALSPRQAALSRQDNTSN
jgi:hypothetical protein